MQVLTIERAEILFSKLLAHDVYINEGTLQFSKRARGVQINSIRDGRERERKWGLLRLEKQLKTRQIA